MRLAIQGNTARRLCLFGACVGLLVVIGTVAPRANSHEIKDLKYGAILFEFYQQHYFETLVEYAYAEAHGGIRHHGNHPELLRGGVSLSYGLDRQARRIFNQLIEQTASEEVRNRAWFYLAKLLYLRGEVEKAAINLANIKGPMSPETEQEYRYLAALVNTKLGYFNEAEAISKTFDDDSGFAPYLAFNLGVALGKLGQTDRALTMLNSAARYNNGGQALAGLADRAHLASAYLLAENGKFPQAYAAISNVGASGVYSNRALLGTGWAALNAGQLQAALTPLSLLEERSMAIPEVQEAVLLVPHVYEQLALRGRAANGFIQAYDRYSEALNQLETARKTLRNADMLQLFVKNLEALLDESDWFGVAPTVATNPLSPFVIDLMSDHAFQSVLKDLRDLYAIRNNLQNWQRKRKEFDVIVRARAVQLDHKRRARTVDRLATDLLKHGESFSNLVQRSSALPPPERARLGWILAELDSEIELSQSMLAQLRGASAVSIDSDSYVPQINTKLRLVGQTLAQTNALIRQVEKTLSGLVETELNIHEERLKYYRVQSHLAKARILDRALSESTDTTTPAAEKPAVGERQISNIGAGDAS